MRRFLKRKRDDGPTISYGSRDDLPRKRPCIFDSRGYNELDSSERDCPTYRHYVKQISRSEHILGMNLQLFGLFQLAIPSQNSKPDFGRTLANVYERRRGSIWLRLSSLPLAMKPEVDKYLNRYATFDFNGIPAHFFADVPVTLIPAASIPLPPDSSEEDEQTDDESAAANQPEEDDLMEVDPHPNPFVDFVFDNLHQIIFEPAFFLESYDSGFESA
ncbi:Oidioi.mRNA.OKI2018_I69.chr1.g984.t1.cds [Oikopleura dioica]|uniref:Oidioi.mRNA.OKI2018_I69.PAR.g12800.t1.cds n=1 Tax=Oikopleura dioica TaxID=34765 RepID=A0ABN7SRR9_OIKDI|nr:Oidioi.mRNA.OKI2018_I69.PAR.g12800.t1.cds [Oikopleura dioica]CAG5103884.1 Oidioi.mRNA.OKI2018_I69.chr1.g984.t1.cds [Oikopleura dioica]